MGAANGKSFEAGQMHDLECDDATGIFPMMSDEDFQELKRSIQTNGQLMPIELWQGRLIDGRNRLKACRELMLEPKFRALEELPCGSVVEYVAAANLHRRHLSASQRAMVAARMRAVYDAAARERRAHRPGAQAVVPFGNARDQAGSLVGVSGRSVDSATKVLREGDEALVRACDDGIVSVATAARLATLPKEIQREAIQGGPQAVAEVLRGARPQSQWPLSDDVNELLMLVQRIEDRIGRRYRNLTEMANADGYDKRVLAVQMQQLRRFSEWLSRFLGEERLPHVPRARAFGTHLS